MACRFVRLVDPSRFDYAIVDTMDLDVLGEPDLDNEC